MLKFNEYQEMAATTAIYPEAGTGSVPALMYVALGLAGEAGEIANKVKKLYRDGATQEKLNEIGKELGDVLWYTAGVARELNVRLGDVASVNLEKLFSRAERGVLQGNGDER